MPASAKVIGRTAQIEGYYARGGPEARQYIGHFHVSAERDTAGTWRIAREVPAVPLPPVQEPITADKLVAMLDEARIPRAVVLSEAFWHDGPVIKVADPHAGVIAENDWTLIEAARHPQRLVPFCSFNPLADYALEELDRCAGRGGKGLKFSFAMSGIDIRKTDHRDRVRCVFVRANERKVPIVVHLSTGADYSREHANIFLKDILPASPDIVVQVAHLWGGEGFVLPVLEAFLLRPSRQGRQPFAISISILPRYGRQVQASGYNRLPIAFGKLDSNECRTGQTRRSTGGWYRPELGRPCGWTCP